MKEQDSVLEKIKETWDSQNQLFSNTPFATEQEISQLASSPKVSPSSKADPAPRRQYLWILFNSALIVLSLIVVRNSASTAFLILLLALIALSLFHLALLGYRQLLTHLVDSPLTKLSTLTNLSRQLSRLEKKPFHLTLAPLPQYAITTACCALLLGSTLWTYQQQSATNDAPLIAQTLEESTPSCPAADSQPLLAVNVPPQPHPSPKALASDTPAPLPSETKVEPQPDNTGNQLDNVRIICNQPDCSVEKYYTLFCEFLNGTNNTTLS